MERRITEIGFGENVAWDTQGLMLALTRRFSQSNVPMPIPEIGAFDDGTASIAWIDRALFVNVESDAIAVTHVLITGQIDARNLCVEFKGDARIDQAVAVLYEILSEETSAL